MMDRETVFLSGLLACSVTVFVAMVGTLMYVLVSDGYGLAVLAGAICFGVVWCFAYKVLRE